MNTQFQGNPAGVCPLKDWLPDARMQRVAALLGHPETAFFVGEGKHYRLRWFSPSTEVDLCGHATLASAFTLFQVLQISPKKITFETRSGPLYVENQGRTIALNLPVRLLVPFQISPLLIHLLGKPPEEAFVTDNGVIMCVFQNEDIIRTLRPNLKELERHGQCLLVTAPGRTVDFVSRYFAPSFGVPEDPVTGSAHCILTPYWAKRIKRNLLKAHQLSKEGGELTCGVSGDRVQIAGKARLVCQGEITWNDNDNKIRLSPWKRIASSKGIHNK